MPSACRLIYLCCCLLSLSVKRSYGCGSQWPVKRVGRFWGVSRRFRFGRVFTRRKHKRPFLGFLGVSAAFPASVYGRDHWWPFLVLLRRLLLLWAADRPAAVCVCCPFLVLRPQIGGRTSAAFPGSCPQFFGRSACCCLRRWIFDRLRLFIVLTYVLYILHRKKSIICAFICVMTIYNLYKCMV